MAIIDTIAGFFGITGIQLIIVGVAVLALTIGWFLLKQAIKIAARLFTLGLFLILVLGVGLYLFFVFFQ